MSSNTEKRRYYDEPGIGILSLTRYSMTFTDAGPELCCADLDALMNGILRFDIPTRNDPPTPRIVTNRPRGVRSIMWVVNEFLRCPGFALAPTLNETMLSWL